MRKQIILIAILIVMAMTNPTKEEYVTWLEEKAMQESDGIIEKGATHVISEMGVYGSATTSKDFVLFSIYETEVNSKEEKVVKTVGAFNNFYTISN